MPRRRTHLTFGTVDLPPGGHRRGVRGARRPRRRPGHPVGGRGRVRRQRHRALDEEPPRGAQGGPAGRAQPGPGPQRQHDRHLLRREPRQRVAEQGRPDHAARHHRDRGLPLLPARRPGPEGDAACVREQPDLGWRHPGWVVDHPADGEDDAALPGAHRGGAQGGHREHLPAQDPGAAARHRVRAELLQGLDPRALPQPRLLR